MIVKDRQGVEREIKYLKKVQFIRKDMKTGISCIEDFVEVLLTPKNPQEKPKKDFYPLKEFMRHNPDILLRGYGVRYVREEAVRTNKPQTPSLPNPRYERRGECKRCGWCCKYHNCKNLTFKDGKAVCKIYNIRPNRCRVFPEAPPILNEKCGYYFIDTWEENKVVKMGRDL